MKFKIKDVIPDPSRYDAAVTVWLEPPENSLGLASIRGVFYGTDESIPNVGDEIEIKLIRGKE